MLQIMLIIPVKNCNETSVFWLIPAVLEISIPLDLMQVIPETHLPQKA